MKALLRQLPGMERFVHSTFWRSLRHRVSLRTDPRVNSNFTGFLRLPTQFDALSVPVVDYLRRAKPGKQLKILSIGCSIGAEAYTVASVLTNRHPDLDYVILACDIDESVIRKATEALFDAETEVYNNKRITEEFVSSTFDIENGAYRIKPEIRKHLEFHVANALDEDALERFGSADLIFAQNFLFHLEPKASAIAFDNICRLLGSQSVLYVDGTDLPLRLSLTRKHKLTPLDYKIEEIHNEARWARAVGYPYHYWGLEPFNPAQQDWQQRYATIFLRD